MKKFTNTSGFHRQIILAIFVALFFSLSMTWVELDPVIDHQRNVDILRSNQQQRLNSDQFSATSGETVIINEQRVRQMDGIIFGSALLVIIIIGGVIANIRNV
ncbi:MAG TPA: hypothetical protein VK856_03945 [Anaerolineaceae bacterium]|nr:hypothetical protein [Anaerolineaceae bacterium]